MSELEEEMKPLKLQPELASYAGTVLYPDEESAKWDVDGVSPIITITAVALNCQCYAVLLYVIMTLRGSTRFATPSVEIVFRLKIQFNYYFLKIF